MKTQLIKKIVFNCLPILAILYFLAMGGCSESPTEAGNLGKGPIKVEDIIIEPKAPEPEDTVTLTAVVTSDSMNVGDFPKYNWSAEAGELLENGLSTVHWIAPDSSRIYEVSVTVSNSINTDHRSAVFFVTDVTDLIPSSAGEVRLIPGQDAFYFLHSDFIPGGASFDGFDIYEYSQGSVNPVTTEMPAVDYDFSKDLTFAVHSHLQDIGALLNPVNLFIVDLPSGAQTQITQDLADPSSPRKNQFTIPSISPDGKWIAYDGLITSKLAPDHGGIDSFEVFVYNRDTQENHRLTKEHMDFYPSFSSDVSYLTFISDRDVSTIGWEMFAFPVNGDVVDTSAASLIQLSSTGGMITSMTRPKKPKSIWNPNSAHPYLALIDANGALRLIAADGSGDGVVEGISAKVTSIAWTSDGTKLAVTAGNALYLAGLDRTAQLLYTSAKESDLLNEVAWADDFNLLMYSVERSGKIWYEVVNVSSSLGYQGPFRLTSAFSKGTIETYRSLMSLAPAWRSNEKIFIFVFDGATPSIRKLNISGMFD